MLESTRYVFVKMGKKFENVGNLMRKNKYLKLAIGAAVIGRFSLVGNLQSSAISAGKVWDTTKVLLGYLDKFASRGWGYAYSVWFLRDMKYYADDFYDWLKHKLHRTNFREPLEAEKILKKGFKKIKGQSLAKEEVMDFALRVTNEKNEAQMNKRQRKGADIILMTGTSGCGKSMMAKELANAVSNAPAFVISSGDIDSKNKDSIVSQLFGQRQSNVGYGHAMAKTSEKNCLIAYIERVKHGVVIIEEYDKMHCESLDEVLRAFSDNGSAYVCGQKIDASNITFILTSNESKDSVQCKTKTKEKEVVQEQANSKNINSKNETNNDVKNVNESTFDINKNELASSVVQKQANIKNVISENKTNNNVEKVNEYIFNIIKSKSASAETENKDLSRTSVHHDKSFMNRLTTVEFERLSLEDFEEIIKSEYGKSMPKYWKSYANITLDISGIFKPIAKKAISMDEHGRAPRKIMSKLTGLLSRESRKLKGKKVKVQYDEVENKFFLKIV